MAAEDFGRVLGSFFRGLFGRPAFPTPKPLSVQPPASITAPVAEAPEAVPEVRAQAVSVPEKPVRVVPTLETSEEVESDWSLPPIPKGYQIFHRGAAVSGLHYRREAALRFIRSGERHHLEMEPEPTNPHDKNAIRVNGVTAGERYHLGYVPADIVQLLALLKMTDLVQIRLLRAYAGSNDYVDVMFQFIGPKEHRNTYRAALQVMQRERYEREQAQSEQQ
jgi:hypothetical protein